MTAGMKTTKTLQTLSLDQLKTATGGFGGLGLNSNGQVGINIGGPLSLGMDGKIGIQILKF